MRYDFDCVIDRMGTYSTQWDYAADRFGRPDVLPFSISDTDFAVPDEVMGALRARMEHPIFGYTRWNHADYKAGVAGWFERDGVSHVDMDWVVYSPSVIYSAASIIRLVSEPGDAVVTLSPMYDAFYGLIEGNGRTLLSVSQASAMDGYGLDWDALDAALARQDSKVMLLTNPHNPTGKVFSGDELGRIVELCGRHGVFLISDDIHRDIILGEVPYTPVTDVTTEGVALLCSASKTFNTPGLIGSYALLPEEGLRERFLYELKQKNALSSVSVLGMTAQMEAYRSGSEYVSEMVSYVRANMEALKAFLDESLPRIRFEVPEGTYLAWMDASGLGLEASELQRRLVDVGHVGIMSGETYGGAGYLRMNLACPRSKAERGMERMLRGIRLQASC